MDADEAEMRAMIARWDHIRNAWGLDGDEAADVLGGRVRGPIGDPSSWSASDMERRMRMAVDLAAALARAFPDPARVREWLRTPMIVFGGSTPLDLIRESPVNTRWLRDVVGQITSNRRSAE